MLYLTLALALGVWLILRHPEILPSDQRISFRPRILLANGRRILASPRISLSIAATGLVFGAQLLYLSIAADLFADAYGIRDTFPLYFALLAAKSGSPLTSSDASEWMQWREAVSPVRQLRG